MQFWERETIYGFVKQHGLHARMSLRDWTDASIAIAPDKQCVAQLVAEQSWQEAKRPYYSVYPVVVDALQRVKLDVDAALIELPLPEILLRFAVGQEPVCDGQKLRSMLASYVNLTDTHYGRFPGKRLRGLAVWYDFGEKNHGASIFLYKIMGLVDGMTVEELLDPKYQNFEFHPECAKQSVEAMRLLIGVCLMARDPDLVTPDVLGADQFKFDETGDPKYVEKAHRRGKIGWKIGDRIEVDPHFRRPHFAIRWCEEGRRVPRLRPIKGCIVHRHKATTVPTGLMG